MLIQLPVETWIEILDWLQRRDLLKKLDKLWDREFSPIVQDWLHKYTRNVTIGKLELNNDCLNFCECSTQWEKVPFADVDMPENVTSFKWFTIKFLDFTILAFLRRMSPLFQANSNIHLMAYYSITNETPIPTALRLLMPMIGKSIESFTMNCKLLHFLSTNYSSVLLNLKLIQIWNSQSLSDKNVQILIDWLFTKRDDGQARILIFHWSSEHFGLCEKIQERFVDTTRQRACPFFVRFWIDYWSEQPPIPDTENARTGEQLTFKTVENDEEHYGLITNCPMNTNVEWLNKKMQDVFEWDVNNQQQVIELQSLKLSPQLYTAENSNQQQRARQRKEAHLRRCIGRLRNFLGFI